MKITRNQNGAIQADDQPLNMYLLTNWLITRNNRTATRLRPRQLTAAHIQEFIDEVPKAFETGRPVP